MLVWLDRFENDEINRHHFWDIIPHTQFDDLKKLKTNILQQN